MSSPIDCRGAFALRRHLYQSGLAAWIAIAIAPAIAYAHRARSADAADPAAIWTLAILL